MNEIRLSMLDFLNENNLSPHQVDLVLSSHSGNKERDKPDYTFWIPYFLVNPFSLSNRFVETIPPHPDLPFGWRPDY